MIYVMSDIHGNIRAYNNIIEQINFGPDDTLYIIGDIIDRGKSGIALLRKFMLMKNVKVLMGNHELMMLNYMHSSDQRDRFLWHINGGEITENLFFKLDLNTRNDIINYLESLPYEKTIKVNNKNYLLVHAAPGYIYKHHWKYYDSYESYMVWHRLDSGDYYEIKGNNTVIHGHTPTNQWSLLNGHKESIIQYYENTINIDCGIGFPGKDENGVKSRLACLRLDDMKEFYNKEVRKK